MLLAQFYLLILARFTLYNEGCDAPYCFIIIMKTTFVYRNTRNTRGNQYHLAGFGAIDGGIDLISRCINSQKTFFEIQVLEVIRDLGIKGGTWLDIGTNIGNHLIYFAAECKPDYVLGFEPFEDAYKLATHNILLNRSKMCDANVMWIGLSDKTETLELKRTLKSNVGANSVVSGDKVIAKVDLIPLDSIEIPGNVTFMKIDVESFEINVLRGAKATIQKHLPVIYTEIRFPDEFAPILEFFDRIGYKLSYHSNEHYIWKPSEDTY